MKLFWSSRSPFVRKVMVTAHELGLAGQIACERVVVSASAPNAAVMQHNPLGKLPTLVLDDGSALYDSPVICEYLASLRMVCVVWLQGFSDRLPGYPAFLWEIQNIRGFQENQGKSGSVLHAH